jgi:hypothetical protein
LIWSQRLFAGSLCLVIQLFRFLFSVIKATVICVLLITVSCGIWWIADKPSAIKFYTDYIDPKHKIIVSKLYDRKVVVLGAKNISKDQISALLPNDKDNVYWWLNRQSIASDLQRIKIIKEVVVSGCSQEIPPNCFSIEITERKPSFIAIRGATAVLLDLEGNEFDAVPSSDLATKLKEFMSISEEKPKVVVGLYSEGTSSDQVLARFEYIKQAVTKIQQESKIEFSRIELLPTGELLLKPSKANFSVQFDNNWQNLEGLSDQVTRLKLVLSEVSARIHEVTKIDLAFNRLAVVAYTAPIVPEGTPLASSSKK